MDGRSARWSSQRSAYSLLLIYTAEKARCKIILGLGLYLTDVALTVVDRNDFHEPSKTLHGLSEYDHLHRVFRLCSVHIFRNIRSCSVTEHVRHKMRSLVCVRHDAWDETVQEIKEEGGPAGRSEQFRSWVSFLFCVQYKARRFLFTQYG